MVLFVDETENDELFIVTGLLVNSSEDIHRAYTHFKHAANNIFVPPKHKALLFTEFKAFLLDKDYKKIKLLLLNELNQIHPCVIYSCFLKKGLRFSQKDKERLYIDLLSHIVRTITVDINIIFDSFNKNDFEVDIINSISQHKNVISIVAKDSQTEPGLQFVDNICSVIRLHKTDSDNYNFFKQIENCVIEV